MATKRSRSYSAQDHIVVPPAKKFVSKHRECDGGDSAGLTEPCDGCGRISQKCRDCHRLLWPRSIPKFTFQDQRFLRNLMGTCKVKFARNKIDFDYLRTSVDEYKKKTSFHLRPYLIKDDCARCQKVQKACSLCGQIFFGDDHTPKFSGHALNEYTGFLKVFDQMISADLRETSTLIDLENLFKKMCPSLDTQLPQMLSL